jgi:serpin B
VTDDTRFVLTNAVYFYGTWASTFDPEATGDAEFTALDGTASSVRTMRQDGRFPYAEVDGTQVLDLPYVGGDVTMTLLLPPEGAFESFERGLDAERLRELLAALSGRQGRVALPKFSFDTAANLVETLSALGMPSAFAPTEADFSGMVEPDAPPLYLQTVAHQAAVTVDEEGTEAAAATGVVGGVTSAPQNPFEFVADRPFLFLIRDRPTGAVLFLGRLVDAAAAQE